MWAVTVPPVVLQCRLQILEFLQWHPSVGPFQLSFSSGIPVRLFQLNLSSGVPVCSASIRLVAQWYPTLGHPVTFQLHSSVHWTSQCILSQVKGEEILCLPKLLPPFYWYSWNVTTTLLGSRVEVCVCVCWGSGEWGWGSGVGGPCRPREKNSIGCIIASLKIVPIGRINNIPVIVQTVAWRRPDDKPFSEPMVASFADAYMRISTSMN